jgi:cell division protein FtsI/penicillin-binding protein 2
MPVARCRRIIRAYQLLALCAVLRAASWPDVVGRAVAGPAAAAVVVDVTSGRTLAARGGEAVLPPGSTVKPFTLLALAAAGRVRPGTSVLCRRQLSLLGRQLDCTHPLPPAPLDSAAALAYSCNWFFATLASTDLSAALRNYGFRALRPSTSEQASAQAIGEWGITVTPVELARAYRRLALGPPLAGLEAATGYGTARLARPDGLRVSGKTGTTVHGGKRYGWFAGFAPAGAPRIVVVVLAAGGGGGDAAPAARRIFQALGESPAAPESPRW